MTIFAIITQPGSAASLEAAIDVAYPNAKYAIDGGHGWLISATGTPQEISNKLGITDGSNGAAIVLEIAAYHGRANPNIWSWIKSNWNTAENGRS
jgi:hypothetical protein